MEKHIDGFRLYELLEQFQNKRICVLGDMMLDEYIWGKIERISPEAPVPVVDVKNITLRLGGAANVIHNILSLGAIPFPIGLIGEDENGQKLLEEFKRLGINTIGLQIDKGRPTTIKTRVLAHNRQQVVRIDRETCQPIPENILEHIIHLIETNIEHIDAFLFEDYNKGAIIPELIKKVVEIAKKHNKITTVDPKFDNFFAYKNVTLFKPNIREIENAMGIKIESEEKLHEAGKELLKQLQPDALVITRGEKGITLLEKGSDKLLNVATKAREVYDSSGAGDTVISTLTVALTAKASLTEATCLANYAAGIVCEETGTVPIRLEQLQQAINIAFPI